MKTLQVEIKTGLAGEFRLHKGKSDAEIQPVTGWMGNHITNGGLNAFAGDPALPVIGGGYVGGCKIGSGNTPPADTDTDLVARLASSDQILSRDFSKNVAIAPYYIEIVTKFRFPAGLGTGNIAELGIIYGSNSGSGGAGGVLWPAQPLFSRALCTDAVGAPTVVTKLADEIVDVEYRLRLYFDTADSTGTINIDGTDYASTLRPVRIDQLAAQPYLGWGAFALYGDRFNGMPELKYRNNGDNNAGNAVYTGSAAALAPVSGENPSGTLSANQNPGNLITVSNKPYVSNSHELEHIIKLNLGTANTGYNHPQGIGVFTFINGFSAWQLGLTPNLIKTNDEEVSLSIFHTWGRYAP